MEAKKKKAWNYVLYSKKSLPEAEATAMQEALVSSAFEQEYWFE